MKRRAQLGFHAQCLLHHYTDSIPENIKQIVDMQEVTAEVCGGKTMTEDLQNMFRSKQITPPLAGPPSKKKQNDITVFMLDLVGTIAPMPYAASLRRDAANDLEYFIQDHVPQNKEVLAAVHNVAQMSPEVKAALDEAEAAGFKNKALNDTLRKVFVEYTKPQILENSKSPAIKVVVGMLLKAKCISRGLKTSVFSDVKPFLEVVGRKKDGHVQENAEKKSCVIIFSSSSVEAQEIFLGNTREGDLTPYITAYIDPNFAGSKLMPRSYSKIRGHLKSLLGEHIKLVFVTGSSSEASAAETSGDVDASILCMRPLNEWMTIDTFVAVNLPHVVSLSQITQPELPVDFGDLAAEAMRSSV